MFFSSPTRLQRTILTAINHVEIKQFTSFIYQEYINFAKKNFVASVVASSLVYSIGNLSISEHLNETGTYCKPRRNSTSGNTSL